MQAVVIGAGLAGLATARVLSDHCEQVIVLERDAGAERPGVPQGLQAHIVLAAGQRELERLFPGLDEKLSNAPTFDYLRGARIVSQFGTVAPTDSDAPVRLATRPFLETTVRQMLPANVRLVTGAHVRGLLVAGGCATGVSATLPDGSREDIHADLVIDASGRSSKLPEWLAEHGYARPDTLSVNSGVSYVTRRYKGVRLPEGTHLLWVGPRAPDLPRCGMVFEQEDGIYTVLLYGMGEENKPPTDDAGFLAFARSLNRPDVHAAIADATPLANGRPYGRTENSWRRYSRLPGALVPIGDAVCSFNPIYGQGITVAIQQAVALGDALARKKKPVETARSALRRFEKILSYAWDFAIGDDYKWPTTQGPPITAKIRFGHFYLDHVWALAVADPSIARTFARVIHCLEPATALFAPRIALRVFKRALSRNDSKLVLERAG